MSNVVFSTLYLDHHEQDVLEPGVLVQAVFPVLPGDRAKQLDEPRHQEVGHRAGAGRLDQLVQIAEDVGVLQVLEAVRGVCQVGDQLQGVQLEQDVGVVEDLGEQLREDWMLCDSGN